MEPDPDADAFAKRIASLTEQEKNAHPRLVEVRNAIQSATSVPRADAAKICNQLSHRQCDAIIKANGDETKIRKIAETISTESATPEPTI